MKLSIFGFLLICISLCVQGQELQTEPYYFKKNQNDTFKAERTWFSVPENRNRDNGKTLELSFIRFKSTNPNPGYPIVLLSERIGYPASRFAKGKYFNLCQELRKVADVIIFDQRGTGLSNNLPFFDDKNQRLLIKKRTEEYKNQYIKAISKEDYIKQSLTFWKEASDFYESQDVDLSAYNIRECTQDLEDLRKAIGHKKLSFWGMGQASHLIFNYIRNFESNIDRIVLASPEDPQKLFPLPSEKDTLLKHICELAEEKFGDTLTTGLWKKVNQYHNIFKKQAPIFDYNGFSGQYKIELSYFDFQNLILEKFLKNPMDSYDILGFYNRLGSHRIGDFDLEFLNNQSNGNKRLNNYNLIPFLMLITSGISEDRILQIDRELESSLVGIGSYQIFFDLKKILKFPEVTEIHRSIPTNSKVNILFLSYANAIASNRDSVDEISMLFKNGKHIVIENTSENLFEYIPIIWYVGINFLKRKNLGIQKIVLDPYEFK